MLDPEEEEEEVVVVVLYIRCVAAKHVSLSLSLCLYKESISTWEDPLERSPRKILSEDLFACKDTQITKKNNRKSKIEH